MKLTDVVETLTKYEYENDLFKKKFLGINFWILIRLDIFINIQNKLFGLKKWENRKKKNNLKSRFNRYMKAFESLKSLKNIKKIDYLIISHPRKNLINGFYECKYTFFLKNEFKLKGINYLELQYKIKNFDKSKLSTEFIDITSNFFAKILTILNRYSILKLKHNKFVEKIFKIFDLEFEKKKLNYLNYIFFFSLIRKPFYKFLLKTINPKVIFLVDYYSYNNILICQIAEELNIKTVEFQHGPILKQTFQYSFNKNEKKIKGFPNYFLSFGKKWANNENFPLKLKNKFNLGFAYLENYFLKSNFKDDQNNILIISQPSVENTLLNFTFELASKTKKKIIFKTHPKERENIKYYENNFKNYQNIFIDNTDEPYDSIQKSSDIIGISSTLLFEATKFYKNIYIIECESSFEIKKFDKINQFNYIKDAASYLKGLKLKTKTKYVDNYFDKFDINNFRKIMDKIESE